MTQYFSKYLYFPFVVAQDKIQSRLKLDNFNNLTCFVIMHTRKNGRNEDLDIVKGSLVVVMLIYHCASMAGSSTPALMDITYFTHFLHFSFLLITGFLCGWHYYPKFQLLPHEVSLRLRIRAGKMVIIFLVMNIIAYAMSYGTYDFSKLISILGSPKGLFNNLIIGVNGRLWAVEILIYFAYFLFVAPFLIGLRYNVQFILFLLIAGCIVGVYSPTILFLSFAVSGMLVGILAQKNYFGKLWKSTLKYQWITPLLLLIYCFQIHFMRETIITKIPQIKVALYSLETFLWYISFLFLIKTFCNKLIIKFIILLGKYTLFSYLSQMFIIKIGYRILTNNGYTGYYYYFTNLILSTVFLTLLILLIDKFRKTSNFINNGYQLVFQ